MRLTADELSPEREERLIVEMLRERGAIDPSRLGPVIDLAALGLVNSAWRNTCVEGWHAEGRLHDGDMMRVSSHMTWRARQTLHRWMIEVSLVADGPYQRSMMSPPKMPNGLRSGYSGGW